MWDKTHIVVGNCGYLKYCTITKCDELDDSALEKEHFRIKLGDADSNSLVGMGGYRC